MFSPGCPQASLLGRGRGQNNLGKLPFCLSVLPSSPSPFLRATERFHLSNGQGTASCIPEPPLRGKLEGRSFLRLIHHSPSSSLLPPASPWGLFLKEMHPHLITFALHLPWAKSPSATGVNTPEKAQAERDLLPRGRRTGRGLRSVGASPLRPE